MLRLRFLVLALLGHLVGEVTSLSKVSLFPFGTVQGDRRLPVGDDVSSRDFQLITPISFYDDAFTSIFVNLNGLISFETELPAYRSNMFIPFGYKVIAPFFADVDINLSGNVYYRETQDPSLLENAAKYINRGFQGQQNFQPQSLVIITWDDVASYMSQFQPTNTFQVVIASDGRNSFAIFLYPEDGINWIKGQGKDNPIQDDPPAQVGFDSGTRGLHYKLRVSGTTEVSRLSRESNFNEPGVWVFKIGRTNGQNIITPESTGHGGGGGDGAHAMSCAAGGQRRCHTHARCNDYHSAGGSCCECIPPHIGNGKECIRPDEPQRVSGKFTGNINGEYIDGVDLHAYVVTTDGRTYTAISRIPSSVGHSLQNLYTVGSVLGFLFALPQQPTIKNGYMLTGGQFNRSATIQFENGRESVTLRQSFTGQDAQGHMRMTTQVDGSIPRISNGAKVEVDDYSEEYHRVSPGVLTSKSTQTFRVDGVAYRLTIDQTINYAECPAQTVDMAEPIRLSVARNFVAYSETEQIVRYSQTNKATFDRGDQGAVRPPVDVCQSAQCDSNADCIPETGSYRCVCRDGFDGDGYQCRRATCDVLRNCDQFATCDYDYDTRQYSCKCNQGYRGDGYRCEPERRPEDCSVNRDLCDRNAQCAYDERMRGYVCRCTEGFEGDGTYCRATEPQQPDCSRDPRLCDRNARCEVRGNQYVCVCNPPYQGDGRSCATGGRPSGGDYLLYAQGMYIMESPFDSRDSNSGKQTLYVPGQLAVGIDADCSKKNFYWTDVTGKTISKARLDGSDSQVVVRDLGSPEGVAIDWLSENMYWTDSALDRIEVAKTDGTNQKTLISTDLVNPRSIAVDPVNGVMFWTDWNREAPKIEKSNMDGTDRQTLISDGLALPNGLALDFRSNSLCWGDAGTRKIECSDYTGRGRRAVSESAGYPFGVVSYRDAIYWSDWERSSLPNTNRNSNQANADVTLPEGANGKLYGITVVRDTCPQGSNQCMYNNGGCRYLCLPTASGGKTCACPNGMSDEECRRSQ